MAQWIISKYDSLELLQEWRIPGNISAGQIEELLKRLASRDLTEMEVINSSLRKNSRDRINLLDRKGTGPEMHVGENPYYLAHREQL
ncbi:hypothetical protein ACQU0X_25830 [Pseudovibrio ascidiaceicola]|uniref:hypothetical protein n=1 Tax=Pseudovibrio ascidiaceicola TaxID=285279 RepID=UPI003D367138